MSTELFSPFLGSVASGEIIVSLTSLSSITVPTTASTPQVEVAACPGATVVPPRTWRTSSLDVQDDISLVNPSACSNGSFTDWRIFRLISEDLRGRRDDTWAAPS
jgi:hypothetical protein